MSRTYTESSQRYVLVVEDNSRMSHGSEVYHILT